MRGRCGRRCRTYAADGRSRFSGGRRRTTYRESSAESSMYEPVSRISNNSPRGRGEGLTRVVLALPAVIRFEAVPVPEAMHGDSTGVQDPAAASVASARARPVSIDGGPCSSRRRRSACQVLERPPVAPQGRGAGRARDAGTPAPPRVRGSADERPPCRRLGALLAAAGGRGRRRGTGSGPMAQRTATVRRSLNHNAPHHRRCAPIVGRSDEYPKPTCTRLVTLRS